MNSKSNQVSILITIMVTFLAVGGIAAYKILMKREKDDLQRSLKIESESIQSKIESLFKDPQFCQLNFAGKNKDSHIEELVEKIEGNESPIYSLNKNIGRLKIDKMKLELVSEELKESQVRFLFSMSNFADENSLRKLGIQEFKYEIMFRVDDCPTEIVVASDENTLRSNCESLPPEGLGGKAEKIMAQGDLSPDFPYLMECKVCRLRNRDTILKCLN
ncbi:MAG: hypothetical protein ACOYL6_12250 [Bacteriovoracaceae bacterium]